MGLHCAGARVEFDVDGNGAGPRVALTLGELRAVGAFTEDAWTFLTADAADDLAADLQEMARKVRRVTSEIKAA